MLNIDNILKAKRLTKKEVAKRMELTRESVHRILSGNPTLNNLNKLAAALDVPLYELFGQPSNVSVSAQQKEGIFNCPYCGGKIKVGKE